MLFCIGTSYLLQSDCLVLILKFYSDQMRLCAVEIFVNHEACIFVQTRVGIFTTTIWRQYQLRHGYACAIEILGGVFVLPPCFLDFSEGVGALS